MNDRKLGNVLISLMEDLSRVSTNGSAHVKVNRNLCEPGTFERLFNYFTKGTILERIDLETEAMNPTLECGCGHQSVVRNEDHEGYDNCPSCGRFAEIKGTEYELVEPDPELSSPRKSITF